VILLQVIYMRARAHAHTHTKVENIVMQVLSFVARKRDFTHADSGYA